MEEQRELRELHEDLLWDLMELEAPEKCYVGDAEKPAFLFFPRYHTFALKTKHCLYMNRVGLINTFTSERKALEHLRKIIETANFPVKVYRVSKTGRLRGKRILFAENTIQRIDLEKIQLEEGETRTIKVFNIPEWKEPSP